MHITKLSLSHVASSVLVLVALCLAPAGANALVPQHPEWKALNGKTIRHISIVLRPIFEGENLNWVYKTANDLKLKTKRSTIEQELLFEEGDPFDAFTLEESLRQLRSLRYLRDVEIFPKAEGDVVDIIIQIQDTWTIIPQFSFSSGDGREKRSAGMAESNLLGLGKRIELLYSEDDGRESIEGVYDARRFMETPNRLLLGYFDRNDGEQASGFFGKPYRSLLEKQAWSISADYSDTIGRLWFGGDERYIYRQKHSFVSLRHSKAFGSPHGWLRRYYVGFDYTESRYFQADESDYDDLDLDPDEVSNDPRELAENRRFSGPVLTFESLKPDFIEMNYIDRFSRVQDYNLGQTFSFSFFFAPEVLGSLDDTLLFTGTLSEGIRFSRSSFLRAEIGATTRYDRDGLTNSILRGEVKFYRVLGDVALRGLELGQHTLAASFFLDYGEELDRDREFLLGGDNALRGYKSKTFTGDKRFAINLEDRVHIAEDLYQLISVGAAIFVDGGAAGDQSLGTLLTDEFYSNVGAGLRIAFPRSSGERVLRIDCAWPLRDGPDGSEGFELRVIFSGGQLFSSDLRSEQTGLEKANLAVGVDR